MTPTRKSLHVQFGGSTKKSTPPQADMSIGDKKQKSAQIEPGENWTHPRRKPGTPIIGLD